MILDYTERLDANERLRRQRKKAFDAKTEALKKWLEKVGELLPRLHPKTAELVKEGGALVLELAKAFQLYADKQAERIAYFQSLHEIYLESYKILLADDEFSAMNNKLQTLQFQNDCMVMELWTLKSPHVIWQENEPSPRYRYEGNERLIDKRTGQEVRFV